MKFTKKLQYDIIILLIENESNEMKNIEKYKDLPVSEVWKIYIKEREKNSELTFQDFLDREEPEWKFKAGDLIQVDHNCDRAKRAGWNHDVVFRVVDFHAYYYLLKKLTPLHLDLDGNEDLKYVFSEEIYDKVLIEEICHLY